MANLHKNFSNTLILFKRLSHNSDSNNCKFIINFNKILFSKKINFTQDCIVTIKKKLTAKGLHFQKGKFCQAKIVTVISGSITDFAIDLRPKSKNFLKYYSVNLSAKNLKALYIPKGFAHGYITNSSNTTVCYKLSGKYNPNKEIIINWKDPVINIKLPKNVHLSAKDKKGIFVSKLKTFFC